MPLEKDGSSPWDPVTHLGDADGIPGSWLRPGPRQDCWGHLRSKPEAGRSPFLPPCFSFVSLGLSHKSNKNHENMPGINEVTHGTRSAHRTTSWWDFKLVLPLGFNCKIIKTVTIFCKQTHRFGPDTPKDLLPAISLCSL